MAGSVKTAAIIAAGGKSRRMSGEDKLLADLGGVPVMIRAVSAFERAESVSEIIIAAAPESAGRIRDLCEKHGVSKLKAVVNGGESRRESVLNAVNEVSPDIEIIAVHDGARPFITPEDINKLIASAKEKGAVIPAVRVKDTIKTVSGGRIISTPDRDGLYAAQTPQVFRLADYLEAARKTEGVPVTDDALMLEEAGFPVFITEGDYNNIKITTPEDLTAVRAFLEASSEASLGDAHETRIGFGYDVHRLTRGRKLILCGVEVPNPSGEGLLGHSDADVAVHALMDALLGALALGDIGTHFPDTSAEYEGISSLELLRRVIALTEEKGYAVSNFDVTIIAEQPKLSPYIIRMRENLAGICKIPLGAVSVKATTEEGLWLSGKGIGANCVCMVRRTG
jgi:2-C-methyl-D-erythritol 4-phosphate cytidylyltransferase/2-C-methyl-D-erythritol 2,4-cyclodiphosphate synthase